MFKQLMQNNEIISLTIMLMMIVALVASQADATIQDEVQEQIQIESAMEKHDNLELTYTPLRATIEGRINGQVLTISIDTMSDIGLFRLESK